MKIIIIETPEKQKSSFFPTAVLIVCELITRHKMNVYGEMAVLVRSIQNSVVPVAGTGDCVKYQ